MVHITVAEVKWVFHHQQISMGISMGFMVHITVADVKWVFHHQQMVNFFSAFNGISWILNGDLTVLKWGNLWIVYNWKSY